MANKYQTLLNINAIMKQRVEKQFAELVKQGQAIKSEIETINIGIDAQKSRLTEQTLIDPLSLNLFSDWEVAQARKIQMLRQAEISLKEKQGPLRKELASIFVKEKMLLSKLDVKKKQLTLKKQKDRAEKTQSVWMQNNF